MFPRLGGQGGVPTSYHGYYPHQYGISKFLFRPVIGGTTRTTIKTLMYSYARWGLCDMQQGMYSDDHNDAACACISLPTQYASRICMTRTFHIPCKPLALRFVCLRLSTFTFSLEQTTSILRQRLSHRSAKSTCVSKYQRLVYQYITLKISENEK